jgi:hypothetical protein
VALVAEIMDGLPVLPPVRVAPILQGAIDGGYRQVPGYRRTFTGGIEMKSRTVAYAFALTLGLAAPTLQAQVSVGPMAGVAIYTFTGSGADIVDPDLGANFSKTSRVGFLAGGFAEFEFGEIFAVEPQLLWVQRGAKYEVDLSDGSGSGSLTFKLDYIQVPVLFKAEYRKAGQEFAPSLFAGPAVAFRTSCKLQVESGSGSLSDDCPANTVSGTAWSLIFGVGLEYSRFVFQARYDLGLSSVAQGSADDFKNGGWGITLGYGFPIR